VSVTQSSDFWGVGGEGHLVPPAFSASGAISVTASLEHRHEIDRLTPRAHGRARVGPSSGSSSTSNILKPRSPRADPHGATPLPEADGAPVVRLPWSAFSSYSLAPRRQRRPPEVAHARAAASSLSHGSGRRTTSLSLNRFLGSLPAERQGLRFARLWVASSCAPLAPRSHQPVDILRQSRGGDCSACEIARGRPVASP
jgi:hypothetical protein